MERLYKSDAKEHFFRYYIRINNLPYNEESKKKYEDVVRKKKEWKY